MEAITFTHNGVVVAFCEKRNRWEFIMRGRFRYATTPQGARDIINAPPTRKPFKRVAAICVRWGNASTVTIISVMPQDEQVWVVDGNWRSKANYRELYEDSKENRQLVAEFKALEEQAQRLAEQATKKLKELKPLKLPKE